MLSTMASIEDANVKAGAFDTNFLERWLESSASVADQHKATPHDATVKEAINEQ